MGPFQPPARRKILTVLDVAIAIAAGTGLLLQLGVRGRISLLGLSITAVSTWRPFATAGALLLIRLLLARTRPVPALVDPALRSRLDAERRWFAGPGPMPRESRYYAAALVLVSLVWLTPHILHIRRVPDFGDPLFSAWRIARLAHQLTHDPAHLFDGNTFYPERYTLTYSDATFLEGLAGTPFILAGVDPLVVSNLVFLAAFPICALAFFYTGWRLTADLRAGFVSGLLGGLYPFHLEHYSHLELQYFCFVPLATVALLRLLAAPQWRRGLALGSLLALQWLACMYFGVMLPVFLVPVALFAIVGWRVRPTRDLWLSIGATALVGIVGFSILAVPFMKSRATRGERSRDAVTFYSAVPRDYGRPHGRMAMYGWLAEARQSADGPRPERDLFPGTSTLAIAAVGMLPPLSIASIATIGATALAFDSSLGTNGLVYDDLYRYLLPYRGLRVPARFGALVGCGLAMLGAFGARRLITLPRSARGQTMLFAAHVLLVLVDLRPAPRLIDYPPRIPSIYSSVSPEMVLAEFPFDAGFDFIYFSTFHWARMVNGYSGYTPDSYERLRQYLADNFPSAAAIETLRGKGVTHITINCARYRERNWDCNYAMARLDALPSLTLVSSVRWEGDVVRLYQLK
jgi:hypothetical protein